MWSAEELELLSPNSIQKRIPFTISTTEISNFIGNMTLTSNFVPTSVRSKYILQAILREIIINKKVQYTDRSIIIPSEIQAVCATPAESCLVAMDCLKYPDICEFRENDGEQVLATVLQIHPEERQVKGICIVDFGLAEKQTIHLAAQQLIRIPVPESLELEITIALTQGTTKTPQRTTIKISKSTIGLIIDTRDIDILIQSGIQQSKELVGTWMKSLDLQYMEG